MEQGTRPAPGLVAVLAIAAALALGAPPLAVGKSDATPIVLRDQGSFLVGGSVVTNPGTFDPIALTPDGQTIHGDHAYVQYQIPLNPRRLPLVMWHGGGQFSKTWETTPDGRDGFQNIFVKRGFSTYILDQPGRGRAGRTTTGTTIAPVPGPGPTGEQGIFIRFRIGMWPDYFPGVQFPRDAAALEQWWRQQTPDTGAVSTAAITDAAAALFAKIGPAILITHSASGVSIAVAEVIAVVGGLIPLFLTGGALWHPLTAVHIVGLLLATVLTLVMLPTLYYVFCAKLKFIK